MENQNSTTSIKSIETVTNGKGSFIKHHRGGLAYAENGSIKTYTNKKQAQKKCDELNVLGINVSYTMAHPFLIVPLFN